MLSVCDGNLMARLHLQKEEEQASDERQPEKSLSGGTFLAQDAQSDSDAEKDYKKDYVVRKGCNCDRLLKGIWAG
jgi:hypothetical protein